MILISTEKGLSMDFPSSWDELKPAQIGHIWQLQDRCLRSGGSPMELSVRILFYLLGIKPGRKPGMKFLENIYILCEQCLGFLFSNDGATLQYRSMTNPLPRMGLRVGPGDLLKNLTFGEFRHAAVSLQAYARSNDTSDLDECIAILYRTPLQIRANRAGRRVSPPGSRMAMRDLSAARHTEPWKKALALSWFCHTMQYLQSGKLIMDGEQVDMSLLFSSAGKRGGTECSWNDLLVQLARDGILGNIDRVDEEPLMSVFSIMWSNYKEAKRYEATLKTQTTH